MWNSHGLYAVPRDRRRALEQGYWRIPERDMCMLQLTTTSGRCAGAYISRVDVPVISVAFGIHRLNALLEATFRRTLHQGATPVVNNYGDERTVIQNYRHRRACALDHTNVPQASVAGQWTSGSGGRSIQ